MVNEKIEKDKRIKEIRRCQYEIKYWEDGFVFLEDLDFETVKEISILMDKLWLAYYKLYLLSYWFK